VLTGVAAALKLTPMIFVLYLLAVRRWRAALTATIAAAGCTILAAIILPGASLDFWGRLAHGDTGLGHSLIYYTNQSVYADSLRIFDLAPIGTVLGLLLSAAVVGLGVWAAAVWHRAGEIGFAVTLCGVASLLASPVSWLHHFVWVVPLTCSLVELTRRRAIPTWLTVLGWVFVGWVVVSPYRRLPNGGDLELTWSAGEDLLASMTAILGIALLVAAALVGRSVKPAPVSHPEALRPAAHSG
jgi:alpha-1,2-mannosyltransferase